MNETLKCQAMRKARGDFDKYLRGHGIDIGCGRDPLRVELGQVDEWDWEDGDAQFMASVGDDKYDFVYSSHCLEHVRDVGETLQNWTRILKTAGHLYFVIPDYIFYEKMQWPSVFNPDHKHSFSMSIYRHQIKRDNHWNIHDDLVPLIESIGVDIVHIGLELDGFDFNAGHSDQTLKSALSQICIIGRKK